MSYFLEGYECFNHGEYEKAIELLTLGAKENDQNAQYMLGCLYADGLNVTQDLTKAAKFFEAAAIQGDSDAQCHLGKLYYHGEGVEQNLPRAIALYTNSAEQNNPRGQLCLAMIYEQGKGVKKDISRAIELYTASADQGNSDAALFLGCIYDSGTDIEQDFHEALKWFHRAALLGNGFAQLCLGRRYFHGVGVEQNFSIAEKWFFKSAMQDEGNAMAEFYLGQMYEVGSGVEKNINEAIKWYQKSAEHEELYYSPSSYALGRIYFEGRNIKPDLHKAKEYFQKAIEQGYSCHYVLKLVENDLGELKDQNKMREYADFLIKRGISKNKLYNQILTDIQKDFGDTWNIVDKKTKTCIVSAIFNYVVLYSYGVELCGNLDFSGIVLDMFKALEIELAKYLYSNYIEYLKSIDFPPELFDGKRSFLKRIGTNEFDYKDPSDISEFTLGNMHLAVGFEYSPQTPSTAFYKYYIDEPMIEYLSEIFKSDANQADDIIDYIVSLTQEVKSISDALRNPAAHNEIIKFKRAEVSGNYIVKVQRLLIEFLEKIDQNKI